MSAVVLCLLLLVGPALADAPRVAAVGSDDPALPAPIARTDSLTADQILDMVRLSVDRIGGMERYVPADADTVTLKPNVTIVKPSGSGIVTDTRVVRAVALLVHEVAPDAAILIAEASGGWIEPAHQDCSLIEIRDGFVVVADGWDAAGHRQTMLELRERGVDAHLVDLNLDQLDTLRLADGFADSVYILPRSITRADAWINLPVAKPHGSKMTNCLKNRFGILPGTVYGYGKSSGTSRHRGIQHKPQILDETLVDIMLAAPEDLCVCDLIHNTEGGAFSGDARRSNAIVAGSDGVSADLVTGRIMGFNPDDFEFADLAFQRGFGPRFIEHVDIGSDLPTVEPRFTKAGGDYGSGDWSQHANYGMGPRRWLLLDPLPRDHAFSDAQLRDLRPQPGVDGWSNRVFFGSDRIDLDRYFDDPVNVSVYAYTTFTMARSDSVRFWLGSDDAMSVWIDGELIYEHTGRRGHVLGGDRLPGYVEAGEHELLIRVEQARGRFDFSFNICEPIDDDRFAGNRYPGVRYAGEQVSGGAGGKALLAVNRWDDGTLSEAGFDIAIPGLLDPLQVPVEQPDSTVLGISQPAGPLMVDVLSAMAGTPILPDTAVAQVLHNADGWFGYVPLGTTWYRGVPTPIERYFDWMGIDHAISYGYGAGEAQLVMRGWLAQGQPVTYGYGDDWFLVDGYRTVDEAVEFHIVGADSSYWTVPADSWWGRMTNGRWVNTPVLTARRSGEPLPAQVLVDSLVHGLLDKATADPVEDRNGAWGQRQSPSGLAAYDAWVIGWERFPWTSEWAMQDWPRKSLHWKRRPISYQVQRYAALAKLLRWAAQDASTPRRAVALADASRAYEQASALADTLHGLLPESTTGDLTPEEQARHERLGEVAGLPRQIRSSVRQALTSLAQLTGGDLPPPREDPLRDRDKGVPVATWSTSRGKGVYVLTVGPKTGSWQRHGGREPLDPDLQWLAAPVEGWQLLVERHEGMGIYQIMEQPGDSNGWNGRVLLDDDSADFNNPVEVTVWSFPREAWDP